MLAQARPCHAGHRRRAGCRKFQQIFRIVAISRPVKPIRNAIRAYCTLALALVVFVGLTFTALVAPQKPDVLFVLADDLGWKDVGFHGSDIATPNLDKLAANGVKLEQFYAQPMCTPTRAALMDRRPTSASCHRP